MGSTAAPKHPHFSPAPGQAGGAQGRKRNGSVAGSHCSLQGPRPSQLCCQTGGRSSRPLSSPASPSPLTELRFGEDNLTQPGWNEPETMVQDSGRRTISCGRKEITGTVRDTWLEGVVHAPGWSEHFNQPSHVGEFKNGKGWTAAVTSLDAWPRAPHPSAQLLISLHLTAHAQELAGTTQL